MVITTTSRVLDSLHFTEHGTICHAPSLSAFVEFESRDRHRAVCAPGGSSVAVLEAPRDGGGGAERFFDDRGRLRPAEVARLHADIGTLLLPSAARAVELDRAYMAIVGKQSFVRGRDAVLAPTVHAYARAPVGERTGIERVIER